LPTRNSTWRALARKELYEELFVRDSGKAAAALSVEGAREAVKRMHLGPYEECDTEAKLAAARLAEWRLSETATELKMAGLSLEEEDVHALARKSLFADSAVLQLI
jgi:hypothetical protein